MTIKRENKTTFIISLILHILLLLFLLFTAFRHRQKVVIIKPAQKKDAGGMPAALLPKRSDQGTKVVFDDSVVLPLPASVKKPSPEALGPRSFSEGGLAKGDQPTQERKPRKKLVKKKQVQEKPLVKSAIKELKEPDPPSPRLRGTGRQADLEEEIVEEQPKVVVPTDMNKVALANLLKEEKEHEKTEQKQVRTQPKKKSLLSLSKCFLDHEKGNSCLMRYGANRFPSLEEMKYICYEKQIEDHIISTWKSLYTGRPVQTTGKVSISFLINEDGKVEDLCLVESSHNKMFDDMVLKCIRSTVFPPIPKHLGVKKYRPRGGYTMLPSY